MPKLIIEKNNVEDILPLTSMQEGILFHSIKDGESQLYIEQLTLKLKGHIDFKLLSEAWKSITKSNELLRTVYKWKQLVRPLQIVLKDFNLPVVEFNLTDLNSECILDNLNKIKLEMKIINLETNPFQVCLCHLPNSEYELIISFHHILFDGWSMGIILEEFLTNYTSLKNGVEIQIPNKNMYKNFISWSKEQKKQKQENFWTSYLNEFETKTGLPYDKKSHKNYITPKKYKIGIQDNLSKNLKNCAHNNKVTLTSIFYTAWALLLHKYNYTNEIVFGITTSGRTAKIPDIQKMTGLFINTLPLRVNIDSKQSVKELLKSIDQSLREIQSFEHTPLVDINTYCESMNNKEGLFDSIVVVENYPLDTLLEKNMKNSDFDLISYSMDESTNFDITLGIETFEDIKLNLIYNENRYTSESIKGFLDNFIFIIKELYLNTDKKISNLTLVEPKECKKILVDFNNTGSAYPKDMFIDQLFEKQVINNPNSYAIISDSEKITYNELNNWSNSIANGILELGTKKNIIGVCCYREVDYIVAILGVLKAGKAFLPITPDTPSGRLKTIVKESNVDLILTTSKYKNYITDNLDIKHLILNYDKFLEVNNLNNLKREKLAYTLFTSGSTGKPKGVMINHESVINFAYALYNQYESDLGVEDKCISLTNISFDVSIYEIFMPLIFGASIVIYKSKVLDVLELTKFILSNSITMAYIPPTILEEVYKTLKLNKESLALNKLLVGVEGIKDRILDDYLNLSNKMKIVNGYGPTEATICTTFFRVKKGSRLNKNVPIGRPVDNNKILILDKNGKLTPIGGIGEINVLGAGVSQGYLNNPEENLKRFYNDSPYFNQKVYKTGDLGKWMSDGNIVFSGRADQQIKLRGYRIELGEIEAKISEIKDITKAIVVDFDDDNNIKYLCAYYISDKNLDIKIIKKKLSTSLPYYMIPTFFIPINNIPITSNGKTDKKLLPKPEIMRNSFDKYVPPSNELEAQLQKVWTDVLNVQEISITRNFYDLGGHSLKATLLTSKLYQEIGLEIPLGDFLRHPTIKELSEYILGMSKQSSASIIPLEKLDFYKLSSSQKRIFVQETMDPGLTKYNMFSVKIISGQLDIDKLSDSFKKLVERHELLRSSFHLINGEPVQKVHSSVPFNIEYEDFIGTEFNIELLLDKYIKPFNLSNSPLLRVNIFKTGSTQFILVFDMHHIISDGISIDILLYELGEFYNGRSLPELKIQYKDYAAWHNNILESENVINQGEYWAKELSGLLYTELPKTKLLSFEKAVGKSISLKLNEELTGEIHNFCQDHKLTNFVFMMSVFKIALYNEIRLDDISIGVPISGRTRNEVQELIGIFLNVIVMRSKLQDESTFNQFLTLVNNNFIEAQNNQDYPYEKIHKIIKEDGFSENSLFSIMFNYMPFREDKNSILDGLLVENYNIDEVSPKYDLTLYVKELRNEIDLNIVYNSNDYKEFIINRVLTNMQGYISKIIENNNLTITDLINKDTQNYEMNSSFDNLFEENEVFI